MRVFNLTDSTKIYKGKPILPNGGSVDFPGVTFVPDRDRKLETKRVLAFVELPSWFIREQANKKAREAKAKDDTVQLAEKVVVADTLAVRAAAPAVVTPVPVEKVEKKVEKKEEQKDKKQT